MPDGIPTTVTLGGADIPLGIDGIGTDGSRAFALQLIGSTAQTLRPDQQRTVVAEGALREALAAPVLKTSTVQSDGVTVRIEMLSTLVRSDHPIIKAPPPTASSIGASSAVVLRNEANYLPDLIVVAAFAYR